LPYRTSPIHNKHQPALTHHLAATSRCADATEEWAPTSIVPTCDQLLESLEVAALTPDDQQFVKNSVRCLCHENALQSLGFAEGSFRFRDYHLKPEFIPGAGQSTWERPVSFERLQSLAGIAQEEMYKVFNMVICEPSIATNFAARLPNTTSRHQSSAQSKKHQEPSRFTAASNCYFRSDTRTIS
jgi:hypothetical protein